MSKLPSITDLLSSYDLMILYKRIKEMENKSEHEYTYYSHDGNEYKFIISNLYSNKNHPNFRYLKYTSTSLEQTVLIWVKGRGFSGIKDARISNKNKPTDGADLFNNGYQIHSGYYNAALRIIGKLDNKLQTLSECKEVIFFGHSVGGAVAALCAAYYRIIKNYENIKAFTFGTPPCIEPDFCEDIIKKNFILTVVNVDDIVTSIGHSLGVCIVNGLKLVGSLAISALISRIFSSDKEVNLVKEDNNIRYTKYKIPGKLIFIQDQIVRFLGKEPIIITEIVNVKRKSQIPQKDRNKVFLMNHYADYYIEMIERIEEKKGCKFIQKHRISHGTPHVCKDKEIVKYVESSYRRFVRNNVNDVEVPDYMCFPEVEPTDYQKTIQKSQERINEKIFEIYFLYFLFIIMLYNLFIIFKESYNNASKTKNEFSNNTNKNKKNLEFINIYYSILKLIFIIYNLFIIFDTFNQKLTKEKEIGNDSNQDNINQENINVHS